MYGTEVQTEFLSSVSRHVSSDQRAGSDMPSFMSFLDGNYSHFQVMLLIPRPTGASSFIGRITTPCAGLRVRTPRPIIMNFDYSARFRQAGNLGTNLNLIV